MPQHLASPFQSPGVPDAQIAHPGGAVPVDVEVEDVPVAKAQEFLVLLRRDSRLPWQSHPLTLGCDL